MAARRYLGLLILSLVLLSSAVHAKAIDDPGITPDSLLWRLEATWDSVRLTFTLGKYRRALKAMEISQERLLEMQAMDEKGKEISREKARLALLKAMDRTDDGFRAVGASEEIADQFTAYLETAETALTKGDYTGALNSMDNAGRFIPGFQGSGLSAQQEIGLTEPQLPQEEQQHEGVEEELKQEDEEKQADKGQGGDPTGQGDEGEGGSGGECADDFVGEPSCAGDRVVQSFEDADCRVYDRVMEECDIACEEGMCVHDLRECSDECDGESQCAGGAIQVCEDLDGDGCMEWSPAVSCDDGTVCQEGACVNATPLNTSETLEIDPAQALIGYASSACCFSANGLGPGEYRSFTAPHITYKGKQLPYVGHPGGYCQVYGSDDAGLAVYESQNINQAYVWGAIDGALLRLEGAHQLIERLYCKETGVS